MLRKCVAGARHDRCHSVAGSREHGMMGAKGFASLYVQRMPMILLMVRVAC
jgi:hypothetical protein